jgi:nucleotide-binding universal stress UspA family protein
MKSILAEPCANTEPPFAENHGQFHVRPQALNSTRGQNGAWNDKRPAFAPEIILVPLALSNSSHAALSIARNLAREYDAKLVLFHVVQLNIADEERGIPRTRLLNDLCRSAEFQLKQLADCMGGQVTTEILVCEGRPAEAIVETARRLRADTIVMCTHGCRGWLKWLHRNTALNVMRQTPCTLWLVSPGKRDATVNLMIVDDCTINRHSARVAFHETPNPFRSLLRVLFS